MDGQIIISALILYMQFMDRAKQYKTTISEQTQRGYVLNRRSNIQPASNKNRVEAKILPEGLKAKEGGSAPAQRRQKHALKGRELTNKEVRAL